MSMFSREIAEARAELLDRGVPEVVDLLTAMDRELTRMAEKVKAFEAKEQVLQYGGF